MAQTPYSSPWSVFLIFLRLGLSSFGGPIAHLGYFRQEFVVRRAWLSEANYADLVALCQFLPGPASSQVGFALGFLRAGYPGAIAAWAGFTLPSAIALILLALGVASWGQAVPSGLLQGLKVAAVAVVVQAVWGMAQTLCPDTPRLSLMAFAAVAIVLFPSTWMQLTVIALAALWGWRWLPISKPPSESTPFLTLPRWVGVLWLGLFALLLLGLPLAAQFWPNQAVALLDAFYRAGALVFGGGHVVLPLLQAQVVPNGWVSPEAFLAGYGAAQAVPGPLFTFAAFLGASMAIGPSGWLGGMVALVGVFMPGLLLVLAALPFWQSLRQNPSSQAALAGVNAAVVGVLLAALYNPVWVSAIQRAPDFALALLAVVALMFWKWPPWGVVLACALGGWVLAGGI